MELSTTIRGVKAVNPDSLLIYTSPKTDKTTKHR